MKFYRCEHCGNIIIKLHDSGVPVVCCGQPMTEMVPGTVDASLEKHVPVVEVNGSKVTVTQRGRTFSWQKSVLPLCNPLLQKTR